MRGSVCVCVGGGGVERGGEIERQDSQFWLDVSILFLIIVLRLLLWKIVIRTPVLEKTQSLNLNI